MLSCLSQEKEESNNDRPATAFLVPLGADGWVAVELQDSKEEEEAAMLLTRLGPALDCLRTSLAVAGRERAAGMRERGRLRGLLREVCRVVYACGCMDRLMPCLLRSSKAA